MNPPGGEQPREYPDKVPLPLQPHWRQDFPTDVPEDDHVARREFVKFLVLTSGAFVAGQCWIAAAARREKGPLPRLRIATVAELEAKQVVEFRYPDEHEPCLALCLGPGRFVAYGSNASGRWEVYVAALASPNRRRQISSEGGGQAHWRRDGKEIFYLTADGAVMSVDVSLEGDGDFAAPKRLFQSVLSRPTMNTDEYDVTSDGKRFIFVQPGADSSDTSAVTVVVNWKATSK